MKIIFQQRVRRQGTDQNGVDVMIKNEVEPLPSQGTFINLRCNPVLIE